MESAFSVDRRGAVRPLLLAAAFVASCAAPQPPRTAAPPPAAGERAYIVFFEFGRADIGPRGRQVVAEAARNAGADGAAVAGRRVELQAHADRAGSAAHNRRLSQRRAEAVAAELARLGVQRDHISVQAHGEGQAFVPTRDRAREGQNRGVWIVIR